MTKGFYKGYILLIGFLIFSGNLSAYAYFLGGSITYKIISKDTVALTLTLYNECYYSISNPSVDSIYMDACGKTKGIQMTYSNQTNVSPLCTNACNRCNSSFYCYNIGGIVKNTYTGKISLKDFSSCSKFVFSYSGEYRTYLINVGANYSIFHIESTLYRTSEGFFDSPQFDTDPTFLYNTDVPFVEYLSAKGNKYDSLYYSLTPPQLSSKNNYIYNSPYSYKTPIDFAGFPSSYLPFGTSNKGFHLDSLTGLISFKPTKSAKGSPVAIKVTQSIKNSNNKYEKASEINREHSIIVDLFSNSIPTGQKATTISGYNLMPSQSVDVCEPASYKIKVTDGGILRSTELIMEKDIPGMTYSTTNLGSVIYNIHFTPNKSNIGNSYVFFIVTVDGFCPIIKKTVETFTVNFRDSMPPLITEKKYEGCGKYTLRVKSEISNTDQYLWKIKSDTISQDSIAKYTFRENGEYLINLMRIRKSGCIKRVTDTIRIDNILKPNAGNDTLICEGSTIQLKGKGGKKYLWSPSSEVSNDTLAEPSITPTKTTVYKLNIKNDEGCNFTDEVKVTVQPFHFTISKDTTICPGSKILLKASNMTANNIYKWSPTTGLSDPDKAETYAFPNTTTTYTLTATNNLGCKLSKEVTIKINKPMADAGLNTSICSGDSIQLNASGGVKYKWKSAPGISNLNMATPIVKPLSSQYYVVTVTDSLGCSATDSVLVEVGNLNPITVSNTVTICEGQSSTLEVSGADSYIWGPAKYLDDIHSAKPRVTPDSSMYFTVTGFDAKKICSRTDSVYVRVDQGCVWPGDANKDHIVNNFDILSLGVAYGNTGNIRSGTIWQPYTVPDWSGQTAKSVNFKHIDTNGDGSIDNQDTAVIYINYGRKYGIPVPLPKNKVTDPVAYVYFNTDTLYAGDTVVGGIYIGTPSKKVSNIYGIGLSLTYDNKWILPGSFNMSLPGDFPSGNAKSITFIKPFINSYDIAIVRTDHKDTSGYGAFGKIKFILLDSNAAWPEHGAWISFKTYSAKAIRKNDEDIAVLPAKDSILVMRKRRKIDTRIQPQVSKINNIHIYPNPANDVLNIDHADVEISYIKLYNMLGAKVPFVLNTLKTQAKLDHLSSGIYFMEIGTPSGMYIEKISIQK